MMRGMVIDRNDAKLQTLEQLRAFVNGTGTVEFSLVSGGTLRVIARTLRRFGYCRLKRPDKTVVTIVEQGSIRSTLTSTVS